MTTNGTIENTRVEIQNEFTGSNKINHSNNIHTINGKQPENSIEIVRNGNGLMSNLDSSTNLSKHPFTHLTLYTGNIITAAYLSSSLKKNLELASAVSETLEYSLNKATIKGDNIVIQDETSLERLIEQERRKYEITVKFFLTENAKDKETGRLDPEYVDSVIKNIETVLETKTIDHFILSLPNQVFDENDSDPVDLENFSLYLETSVLPLWNRLIQLRRQGHIGRLGVAEFSKQQLEILGEKSRSVGTLALDLPEFHGPELNQVNLVDCCVLPKDMISYAKEKNIELLTHGDSNDILPNETFKSLIAPYLSTASNSLKPVYIIKYSAFIHDRGLITHKGYVIDARQV